MNRPLYPSLYQINTRVSLTDLSRQLGRPATLDDIPDAALDRLAAGGFDWVWLLSVWQTGVAGQQISRSNPEWRHEFQETLPDLREEDIRGSGFAITGYTVPEALGGNAALGRVRERLRARGLRLMLDFVPNHTAIDHPWVSSHPEYYIAGTAEDLARTPQNYIRLHTPGGDRIFAHGRDPYFPGWPDTLQLDYSNPATQEAMRGEVLRISQQCDGLRCDMAMLVLPDVFARTWGRTAPQFWPETIQRTRARTPGFTFMAEVYWDLEWTMIQLGFDYAYDKRLYDRLRDGHARPSRDHLRAGLDYQNHLARFLENHDEPRAAATFPNGTEEAAAIVTYLTPGLRFFHDGQFEGRTRRISPHLVRRPEEPINQGLKDFYGRLQGVIRNPVLRDGRWQLLESTAAWDGNWTSDCFIVGSWDAPDRRRLVVAVNYADNRSQCYVKVPLPEMPSSKVRLRDLMGGESFDRDANELQTRGLYLDMPAHGYNVFEVTRL
jgi:glycosidase